MKKDCGTILRWGLATADFASAGGLHRTKRDAAEAAKKFGGGAEPVRVTLSWERPRRRSPRDDGKHG